MNKDERIDVPEQRQTRQVRVTDEGGPELATVSQGELVGEEAAPAGPLPPVAPTTSAAAEDGTDAAEHVADAVFERMRPVAPAEAG